MKHLRSDYNAIQPWPTIRKHVGKTPEGHIAGRTDVKDKELPPLATEEIRPIIPDDEPVFILRAKDVVAPLAVDMWADLVMARGGDPELVLKVRMWADKMRRYAKDHYDGGKTPDTPAHLLLSNSQIGKS